MALKKLCRVLMFSSLILTLGVTISYEKAVPEESQKNYEGHLGYSHENEDPMFKYYDPQKYMFKPSLAIPKQNYYIPMFNEEPILVPPISDSSSDINKLLGKYFGKNERAPQYGDMENTQDYKSIYDNFAPAWKDVPPVAYDYKNEEVDYEEPVILNVVSKNHNAERDDVNSQNFENTPTTHVFLKHGFKQSHKNIKDLESKNKLQYIQPQVTESKASSVLYEDKGMFPGTIKNEMDSDNDKKHGGKNFYVSKVKTSMKITSDDYDYDLPQIHETINIKNAGDLSQKGKVKEVNGYDSPVFTKDIKKTIVDGKKEQLETLTNAPESETNFDLPLVVKVENVPGLRKPHKLPGIKHTSISKETKIQTKSKGQNISIDKEFKGISKPKGNVHSTHIPVLKIKKNPLDKGEKLAIKCGKLKSSDDLECLEKNILDESSEQPNDDFKTTPKEAESESKKPVLKKPGGDNPKTSSEKSKLKSEGSDSESTTEKEKITFAKPGYENFDIPKHQYFRRQSTENFPEFEHSHINNAEINDPKANVEIDLQSHGSGNAEEDPLSLSVDDRARSFLSSFNPNLWSLVFNPNAKNHKLKKCVTRNGESGYCTYIQNCPVPDIATSLEQLLNNACVVDEMFIGVCCPEFPVETVKVHWEQVQKNPNDKIFDDFSHDVEDCGTRSREVSKVHLWPWKAPLVSMSNGKIFCGGVVITDKYVLTAAHCTTKIPKNQILVRLGQHNDSSGEDFPVIEIKRHAQYNPRNLHNDIALLKLGRRIPHNKYTDIVCLPEEDDDNDEHDGDKAILLGWKGIFGENSKKDRPELLEVMSLKECRKKMGVNVPDSILCTETRNEDERTCNADSGAPLIVEDDDKYEVIGILSWNRNDCDQRFPSTFSRVSSYLGWIRKHAV